MSNADPGELVTASSDGVTVEKSFEPDDFPVPAIAFVVRSERDETVTVRLVDSVPSHVPPEDIGFHPKYGAEFWDVEGDTIVFEREFEPDEEYTTVYGLRGGDADDAEKFMSEPRVESVDPPLDEDSGEVVRDVIGEVGEESEEPADDDIASAVQEVDTGVPIDEEDESGPESEEAEIDTSIDLSEPGADGSETETGGSEPAAAAGGESLVSALAAELRSGNVDDEELAELRDALGADGAGGSVEARIEHLQSELADLQAYTDALEEFLDENGTAQQVIEEAREDFRAATERLNEVEAIAEEAADSADSVDERLEEQLDEVKARLDDELEEVENRLDDELEEFEARADDIENRLEEALDDVDETLDEVDQTVDEIDETVEETIEAQLEEELDELWTAVDEAASDVADVSEELETVREEVDEATEERLDDLEAEIAELESELEDVAEMRDRLTSALGGLAPGTDDEDDEE